jgi:large subunit ribosomal protein L18
VAAHRKIKQRTNRRICRVKAHLKQGGFTRPRVSVFRSLRHIYAQIIDDAAGVTLASCSSLDLENLSGDKKAIAQAIGLELAKRAKGKGVTAAIFDRGGFLYHGRVKALAEGLREGGLEI